LKRDQSIKPFFFVFKVALFFYQLLEVMRALNFGDPSILVSMSRARHDTSAFQNVDNVIYASLADTQQVDNVFQINFLTTRGLWDAGGTVSKIQAKGIECIVDKSLLTVTIWTNLWAKVAKPCSCLSPLRLLKIGTIGTRLTFGVINDKPTWFLLVVSTVSS
jgi:hypothetical protein